MMQDLLHEVRSVLDGSTLSDEDKKLWLVLLEQNPITVQAFFVKTFREEVDLLQVATDNLKIKQEGLGDTVGLNKVQQQEQQAFVKVLREE